jgi:hypothetical protein
MLLDQNHAQERRLQGAHIETMSIGKRSAAVVEAIEVQVFNRP